LRDETSEILGKIKENMKTGFRFQALRYEILKQAKKTKAAPTPWRLSEFKASRKDSNVNKINISPDHVYQCKKFISPMQIKISDFPNGLWSLLLLSRVY
jgi:hypothetical protein